jgi:hypothetical protein
MGECGGEQDRCVPQPIEDCDLARREGVTSGEGEETAVALDSLPTQEIGSSAVGGAVGVALRADRCPYGGTSRLIWEIPVYAFYLATPFRSTN